MTVAIIDYGVGNLFSLEHSFREIGRDAVVTAEPEAIRRADRVLLPGVGAFADAAKRLRECGLDAAVRDAVQTGKPVLGICLGMQLLFDTSLEFGTHAGLGLLRGRVVPLQGAIPDALKVPHIGWNALHIERQSPLLRYTREGDCVYFVHSYYAADCAESRIASAEHGLPVTAAVQKDNLYGCQFHPEKSGRAGLAILQAFCETEI